jgi:UDP-glucose 4-epimerase
VLKRFKETDIKQIRIFSRDEKKQEEIRHLYQDRRLQFYIGDVRDADAVKMAMQGVDYVFQAAALKQVPSCEFFPIEAIKTNVMGVENVLSAAIAAGVKKVVCLSTDKAVYPINAMGMTKALMEKVVIAKSRVSASTAITCTRYGNVMASRGSVIPLFVSQVLSNRAITVTNPAMTRFMMTLDEAVDLVEYAFENGKTGDLFVKKSPAAEIGVLARAICDLLEKPNHKISAMGPRHGEKLYESLLSKEERVIAEDFGEYYRIPPDLRDLNYSTYFHNGVSELAEIEDYNSHNTERLDLEGMKQALEQLPPLESLVD